MTFISMNFRGARKKDWDQIMAALLAAERCFEVQPTLYIVVNLCYYFPIIMLKSVLYNQENTGEFYHLLLY